MKWFYNAKLSTKMLLASIAVAVFSCILGYIGLANIAMISKDSAKMHDGTTAPLAKINSISAGFQNIGITARNITLSSDAREIEIYAGQIKTQNEQLDKSVSEYKAFVGSSSNEIKKAFDSFEKSRAQYNTYLDKVTALVKASKNTDAAILLKGDMAAIENSATAQLGSLTALTLSSSDRLLEQSQNTSKGAYIQMGLFLVFCLILSFAVGMVLSRLLGKQISRLLSSAELISNGDLTVSVDIDTKDEIGQLAFMFNKMAINVNRIMNNINSSAQQVSSGSALVSESSMELSQGTQEQASSVEELTASLEQISSQTKSNADNAQLANQLAEETRINAVSGNSRMQAMQKAMEEINLSSAGISKIIKVIDEIAFQTNILALNAAVEAARAGQHGKGFAVVAEEVRNLAARSANAAKETTSLIEGSIKRVGDGTKIADETAAALNIIVGDITKVAKLVDDIAAASKEQATGVEQINQGISQVSGVIQTNAATAQQSAAASAELSKQAEKLKKQILGFKLKTLTKEEYQKSLQYLDSNVLKQFEKIKSKEKQAV